VPFSFELRGAVTEADTAASDEAEGAS
jgi:hypothetical protein